MSEIFAHVPSCRRLLVAGISPDKNRLWNGDRAGTQGRRTGCIRRCGRFFLLLSCLLPLALFAASASAATISFVQGNYSAPQSAKSSVAVKYKTAQSAGDLNVIVVGWNDASATVKTVSDSTGNAYTLAVGPTTTGGALTQSIYFAKNIAPAAAGSNSVTIAFSKSASYPDIRILEYSGADPVNPVDSVAGNSGNNAIGTVSANTTNATDLILAADLVQSMTSGPGAGFMERVITSPDGDIAEDESVQAAGSYTATAPLSFAAPWIMQLVSFRTPSGSGSNLIVPAALSCASPSFTGAGTDTCTVTLNAAAAAGGQAVALASNNSAVTVPSSVTVVAGGTSASFPATIASVGSMQTALLTASDASVSQTFAVQLNPAVPTLTVSVPSLSFGSVAVNSAAMQSLTLSSTGTAAVTVSSATLAGTGFSLSGGGLPLTLNPNQTATISVQFDPPAAGAVTGQLTLASNSSNGPAAISLSGSGVPVLTAFSCSNSSMTGAGTDACTLTLSAAAASGGLTVSLSSSSSSITVPASVTVPAGAASATFSATVASVTTAQTATLMANAGSVSQSFAVQLVASVPTLGLSSSSLAFGNVAVNSTTSQSLTLSSTGTAAVTVNSATLTGTGFSISGASFPLTLNPNQTATLMLQFDPASAGAAVGTLTIASNSSTNGTAVISLSGTGVPVLNTLTCSSASMTGSGTDACSVTLNAAAPSGGFVVNLTSNNSSVTVPASVTVLSGASSASFTASVSAVTAAQLVVLTANAANVDPTFALQLNAAIPTLSVSTSSLSFGNVTINSTAPQSITLSSTGTAAVTVNSATLAGTGFSISGATFPLTLNTNQTATLTVQFDPASAGAFSGTLTINSNSSTGGSAVVSLIGTGVPALSALTCTNASITGAGTDACTVTLNTPAASGGYTVSLASNNSSVVVPASVLVAAGSSTGSFSTTVSAVSTAQTATLTASAGSVSESFALQLNATKPTLSVSASSLSFGSVAVNSVTSQSITLSSTGTAAVTISSVTVTGSGFSISGATLPLTLNPNQTTSLTVQFDPAAAGSASGQVTIASNSSTGSTSAVALTGTGTASTPVITSPAAGSVLPGTAATFTWTNESGVTQYQLLLGTTGPGSQDIGVYTAGSTTGSTISVAVTGLPANGAAVYALLYSNLGGVWQSSSYTYTEASSTPSLASLTCSNATMSGSGSDSCTVMLSSAAPTGGMGVSLASSGTAVSVPAAVIVAAGATSINFSANVASVSTAQVVTLTASSSGISKTFALQLNPSTPSLSINATSIAFGSVALNTPSTQSITLTSTGGAAVTVNSATITGTGFSLSGATFPLTLNPNQTATLSVEFDPTSAGSATGQLTIASNSSTNPTATVSLTGSGGAASYSVSLTWDAPVNSSDPVATYNIYRSPSGASTFQLMGSVSEAQLAYTDSNGIQDGQAYDYIVESVDASGVESAPSNMATVSIQ